MSDLLIDARPPIGDGPPLIMLHGLFGSSRNWTSIAQEMASSHRVHLLDQRNHGDAGHHPEHSLELLTQDLHDWMQSISLSRASILGHSMGGLVAMQLALQYPELVDALIVVDIAPRTYAPHHQKEIAALKLDVSQFTSRAAVDQAMAEVHPDPGIRKFLQMNLTRDGAGYRWKLNVETLARAQITSSVNFSGTFEGPALCIYGTASDYVQTDDLKLMADFFPAIQFYAIANAGHWLHHSHRAEFVQCLQNFLT